MEPEGEPDCPAAAFGDFVAVLALPEGATKVADGVGVAGVEVVLVRGRAAVGVDVGATVGLGVAVLGRGVGEGFGAGAAGGATRGA